MNYFSKRERHTIYIFLMGLALYLGENWYFGWNLKPSGPLEAFLDTMVILLFFLAFLWKPFTTNYNDNSTTLSIERPPTITGRPERGEGKSPSAYCAGIWQDDGEDAESIDEGDLYVFLKDTKANRAVQVALLKGTPITIHDDK